MVVQLYQKQLLWGFKMETFEAISTRRSIRHFNSEEVSAPDIKKIIEAGILSPSAKNRQPWHYIVINKDKDLKNKISDILKSCTDETTLQTCNVIKECSSLILVFATIENEIMDIESLGASIENMLLEATNINVGTLWIGYILEIEKELQKIFKTDKKLISAIALGHFDKNPKPRPRKTMEEVTEWY